MTQQKKVFEEQLLKGIKTQKKESCWKSVRSKNDEDLNEVLREGKAIAQKRNAFLACVCGGGGWKDSYAGISLYSNIGEHLSQIKINDRIQMFSNEQYQITRTSGNCQ